MHSVNGSTSIFLHRSPSGAQRRIRQRMGVEWQPKTQNLSPSLSNSMDNIEQTGIDMPPMGPTSSFRQDQMGYRSLIESSDYQSVLPDIHSRSNGSSDYEDKINDWKYAHSTTSSSTISLNSFSSTKPCKPTPMPRSQDSDVRQRHNSGDNSCLETGDCPLPPLPAKPMLQVHPLPVPRSRPQPPPIPQKPKTLQNRLNRSLDSEKSFNSADFDPTKLYSLDDAALNELETQRIASLTALYEKVGGRWDDLKNLHQEKRRNAELFTHIMEIALRHKILTAPYIRFVKRFETICEVQTRLALNKDSLKKELERAGDAEFLVPLLERNEANTRDVERLVDELDANFQTLDAELCKILQKEEHQQWVFFVRTLYSLIAEQSCIQGKVRYVTDQIKKLEGCSVQQVIQSRLAGTAHKDVLNSSTTSSNMTS